MNIQSKSARILAVVSGLALASACGEGAERSEGAEQQEAPAQMAPDSLKEQEAALRGAIGDFWYVALDGTAAGWVCLPAYPNLGFNAAIFKLIGGSWRPISTTVSGARGVNGETGQAE